MINQTSKQASKLLKGSLIALTAFAALTISSTSMAKRFAQPGATVFQHCDYRGYGVKLRPGYYNLRRLRAMGVRNDDLSSIRVRPGIVVTLYEHVNFRGRAIRLTHNDRCFVNNGFNDKVSSIKVEYARYNPPIVRGEPPRPSFNSGSLVRVYQHCGFRGYGVSLRTGWYNLRALRARGVRNDDLSSIRVPRGYVVTLYEHVNFRGRAIRLTHSDKCFVNNGFNDIVSSIKVERVGHLHPPVRPLPPQPSFSSAPVVHQHCGFRGYGVKLRTGWYNLRDLQARGIRNDDLSSIRVPRGYVVTLYEHANFRGRRIRLTHSDSCFVNNGFNDIVSSIRVQRMYRHR